MLVNFNLQFKHSVLTTDNVILGSLGKKMKTLNPKKLEDIKVKKATSNIIMLDKFRK